LLTILHRNLPGLPALMAAAAFCLDNYKWIQAIVGLSLFSACVVLPLRLWEVLSLLSFSFLMLPLSSPDYRLIHLFLPIVAFIRCKKSDFHSLQIAAVAALLLVPKAFVYVDREISIGCVINPALMVIAATFICLRATTRKTEQAPLMASMWKCVVRPVGALVETNGNTPPPLNVHSVRSGPFASITQA
jgi:hypothetical protein